MPRTRDRPEPGRLSPRAAVKRYLRRRQSDATDASVYHWWYDLKLFVEYCEGLGIKRVDDIHGYDLDEYYELRSEQIAPVTLENEMWTLKMFARYLERIEAVTPGFSDQVHVPDVDDADRSSNVQLKERDALSLLEYYRTTPSATGTRAHAFLELVWTIGARQGGIRSLDVVDVHVDEAYVEFYHRPDSGTPLKRKTEGERPVAITQETAQALDRYLAHHRYDVHDEHGRQPFLASARGRPGTNTIRSWSYLATIPCLHGPCPHGKDPSSCEWTEYEHASKCPSSRSPHQIRTGSITWQLNIGIPPEVVAERVNADLKTIKQHYDKATDEERRRRRRERMERDRRPFVENMTLEGFTALDQSEITEHDNN